MTVSHADLAAIAGAVYLAPWSATVSGDVHYALLPRGDELVVAFPGTHPQSALDWLRDGNFWPSWIRGLGWVHSGFGRGARAAWLRMAPDLPTNKLITIVGHSLGAALATDFAAIHAFERPGTPFRLVAFAPPRSAFLNPWVGRLLNRGVEKTLYARRGDLVPDVPMRPYLHGGRLTTIGTDCGDWIENHAVARYAADVKALGV